MREHMLLRVFLCFTVRYINRLFKGIFSPDDQSGVVIA